MELSNKEKARELIKRSARNGGDAIRVEVPPGVEWEIATMDDCKRRVAYDDGRHYRGSKWYLIVTGV